MDNLRVRRVPVWGVFDGSTQISYDCAREEEAVEWMKEERQCRKKRIPHKDTNFYK